MRHEGFLTHPGTIKAILFVVLSGFYNVLVRFAVTAGNAQPFVFACLSLMFSAIMLYLAAGRGPLSKETLRAPASWLYGITLVAAYIVDAYLMVHITGTQAGLFSRLAIPITFALVAIRGAGSLSRNQAATSLLILLCLAILCWSLPPDILMQVIILAPAATALQVGHFILAEKHPQANRSRAMHWRDEARVVAVTTFISAVIFATGGLAVSYIAGWPFNLTGVGPESAGLGIDAPTVILAACFGLLFLPTVRFLKWSATGAVGTERLFLLMAFVPVLTLAIETALSLLLSALLDRSSPLAAPDTLSATLSFVMAFAVLGPAFLTTRNRIGHR